MVFVGDVILDDHTRSKYHVTLWVAAPRKFIAKFVAIGITVEEV